MDTGGTFIDKDGVAQPDLSFLELSSFSTEQVARPGLSFKFLPPEGSGSRDKSPGTCLCEGTAPGGVGCQLRGLLGTSRRPTPHP